MTKKPANKDSTQIQEKIDEYKTKHLLKELPAPKNSSNVAFQITIELVSAILVGLIIGSFFDYLFDSRPLWVILCIMFACASFFRLIFIKYIRK